MTEMLKSLLLKSSSVRFGKFRLTSGGESRYYVDIKRAYTDPIILKEIARMMADFTVGKDKLAGMELGAVPIVTAVSIESKLPFLILRKGKREHGTTKMIEGELKEGEKVLVIEDVTTSGSSLLRAVEIVRGQGGIVNEALVVVDREEGAVKLLKDAGVELIPLLRVSELLNSINNNKQKGH